MYFSDHNPPYFHAEYKRYKAEYEIKTLDRSAETLPSRTHALVLEWASLHIAELLVNWEQAQVPATLNKIEPLQ